jgi:hypothetical protein
MKTSMEREEFPPKIILYDIYKNSDTPVVAHMAAADIKTLIEMLDNNGKGVTTSSCVTYEMTHHWLTEFGVLLQA